MVNNVNLLFGLDPLLSSAKHLQCFPLFYGARRLSGAPHSGRENGPPLTSIPTYNVTAWQRDSLEY